MYGGAGCALVRQKTEPAQEAEIREKMNKWGLRKVKIVAIRSNETFKTFIVLFRISFVRKSHLTCLKISSVTRCTPRCCGRRFIFRWSHPGWPIIRPAPTADPEPLLWFAEHAMMYPLVPKVATTTRFIRFRLSLIVYPSTKRHVLFVFWCLTFIDDIFFQFWSLSFIANLRIHSLVDYIFCVAFPVNFIYSITWIV